MTKANLGLAGLVCVALAWSPHILSAPQGRGVNSSQSQAPAAQLANGQIQARVYLPDPQKGFYRSTRFDWSGAIGGLVFNGHDYYQPWFDAFDPTVRDFVYRDNAIVASAQSAMVGPVEEFRTPLGFATAEAGKTFVKIGVGVLRKPDANRYSGYANYPIVDSGQWSVRTTADSVESTQRVNDAESGYGYVYRKTVRLTPGKPELVIEHSLQNAGRLPIQTRQYNHNFLVLDHLPTGPDFAITVPFEITPSAAPDPAFAAVEGHQIVYRKQLENQDRVTFGIRGYGPDAKDYDIRIENRSIGAGVRVTSDRPLADLSLWSIRSVISMEPDIDINLQPGATMDWKYTYTYYASSR